MTWSLGLTGVEPGSADHVSILEGLWCLLAPSGSDSLLDLRGDTVYRMSGVGLQIEHRPGWAPQIRALSWSNDEAAERFVGFARVAVPWELVGDDYDIRGTGSSLDGQIVQVVAFQMVMLLAPRHPFERKDYLRRYGLSERDAQAQDALVKALATFARKHSVLMSWA